MKGLDARNPKIIVKNVSGMVRIEKFVFQALTNNELWNLVPKKRKNERGVKGGGSLRVHESKEGRGGLKKESSFWAPQSKEKRGESALGDWEWSKI